jgi:hypothetical protein
LKERETARWMEESSMKDLKTERRMVRMIHSVPNLVRLSAGWIERGFLKAELLGCSIEKEHP